MNNSDGTVDLIFARLDLFAAVMAYLAFSRLNNSNEKLAINEIVILLILVSRQKNRKRNHRFTEIKNKKIICQVYQCCSQKQTKI